MHDPINDVFEEFKVTLRSTLLSSLLADPLWNNMTRDQIARITESYLKKLPLNNYKVTTKPGTWLNLYPIKRDRKLARIYQVMHNYLPQIFPTNTTESKWWMKYFPFKYEQLENSNTGGMSDYWKIEFGDTGIVLVDTYITPTKPIDHINLTVTLV